MMLLQKPERLRSPEHLRRLRTVPCCIPGCRGKNVVGHHLTHAQPKARGLKTSDSFVTPLCLNHHDARSRQSVHFAGGEADWWARMGVDPLLIAAREWAKTQELLAA